MIPTSLLPVQPLQQKKWAPRFWVGSTIGVSSLGRKIQHASDPDYPNTLKKNTTTKKALKWGIQTGIDFNDHWSILSGVSFSKFSQQKTDQINLIYRPAEWQTNGPASVEKTIDVDLKTSYGDIPTRFKLSHRSTANFSDGEQIPIEIVNKQTISFVHIPLLVQYRWTKQRWAWSLKTGMQADILTRKDMSISINKPFGPRRLSQFVERPTREINGLRTTSLAYVLGIGASYSLTDRLQLILDGEFAQQLQPLHKKNEIKTTVATKGLNLGLRFRI